MVLEMKKSSPETTSYKGDKPQGKSKEERERPGRRGRSDRVRANRKSRGSVTMR